MSVLIGILTLSYVFLLLFLLFGFSKIPEFFGKSTAPKTTFSIVIPFRNESENLPALFRSIENLKYPPELYEVILVNDASEDASENLCREFIQANSNLNIQLLQNNRTSESPKKDAIKALPTPMIRETFPPSMTRAKRSLPSLSVPKGCSKEGATRIDAASKS